MLKPANISWTNGCSGFVSEASNSPERIFPLSPCAGVKKKAAPIEYDRIEMP